MERLEGSFGSGDVALVGLLLLFAGVGLIPLGRLLCERLFPSPRVLFVRWGFTHVLVSFLVFVIAFIIARFATDIFFTGILGDLLISLAAFLLTAGFVLLVANQTEPTPSSSLGWTGAPHMRAVMLGVCLYVVFLPAILGAGFVSPWLVERLGGVAEGQEVLLEIGALEGAALCLALLFAVLMQPLLEEFLFRGLLQPLLVQNLREVGGVVLTSVLFAIIHPWVAFLPVFCLSLLLGTLYVRTRSLAAVAVVHGLHNGLVLALFLTSSWWRELSGASSSLWG